MRLLDLFCGAGGCSVGYHRAGFDVVGVDINPQPRYPFEFHQADAFEFLAEHWREFDAFGASPKCQLWSKQTPLKYRKNHEDDITPIRQALLSTGKPYIIENVESARHMLRNPVLLCGSMFGLPIRRHRYFEISIDILVLTPSCRHDFEAVYISGSYRKNGKRWDASASDKRAAMGTPWMRVIDMDGAIPPAYTEFIGEKIKELV